MCRFKNCECELCSTGGSYYETYKSIRPYLMNDGKYEHTDEGSIIVNKIRQWNKWQIKNGTTFYENPKSGCTTVKDVISKLPEEILKTKLKTKSFFVIRNPYERIVSGYKHYNDQLKGRVNNPLEFTSFSSFLNEMHKINPLCATHHFFPQNYFVPLTEDKKPDVDVVLNLKNLTNGLCNIFETKLDVPRKMQSKDKSNYSDFYDDEIEQKVYEIYKEDFEIFGFERGII